MLDDGCETEDRRRKTEVRPDMMAGSTEEGGMSDARSPMTGVSILSKQP